MPRQNKPRQKFLNAFSVCGSDDSNRMRVYTEDTEDSANVESLVHYLELYIHELAQSRDRQGLRTALYKYLCLRGVL